MVRPRALDVCGGIAGIAEIVGERLALLREAGAEKTVEAIGRDAELGEAWGEVEADDGGVDVGRRREGGWRESEEGFDARVELREGGERAVVADARVRGDAVGDFALDHEYGAMEDISASEGVEVEKDVGGDVVGEIADDVEGVVRCPLSVLREN